MESQSNINWDLIAKYLTKEIGNTELEELHMWSGLSENNRRYLSSLEEWWRQTEDMITYGKIDPQKDWQTVRERITSSPDVPAYEPKISVKPLRWWRVAAAVVALMVCVSAVWLYLGFSKENVSDFAGYVTLHVPDGQNSQITLADGTKVWLNSGSMLHFPSDFDRSGRTVEIQGEAYFEVTRDVSKPFEVHTRNITVTVYGTEFNITSYDDDATDVIALFEGSLGVKTGNSEETMLQPNQKVIYDREGKMLSEPYDVGQESISAWRDGQLVFENEPLEVIARKMERRYGVRIIIQDEKIREQRYRGKFRKETLEQALKAIQLSEKFNYIMENDTVIIN